jgi:hypothetical protein
MTSTPGSIFTTLKAVAADDLLLEEAAVDADAKEADEAAAILPVLEPVEEEAELVVVVVVVVGADSEPLVAAWKSGYLDDGTGQDCVGGITVHAHTHVTLVSAYGWVQL